MPLFDVDDLSFFRVYGFGLRHTNLPSAIQEQQEGGERGDAVSLANYGLGRDCQEPIFTQELCETFQKKVERFVLESFKNFHSTHTNYKEAAFLVLVRDRSARLPYDFNWYPLGKCGSRQFSAAEVALLVSSECDDYYDNVEEASSRMMIELANRLRQLKKIKAQAMLTELNEPQDCFTDAQRRNIQGILIELVRHYDEQTYVESDLFLQVYALINRKRDPNFDATILYARQNDDFHQQTTDAIITKLQLIVKKLDAAHKKSNTLYVIKPVIENLEEVAKDSSKLKSKLVHYINHSNMPKINACLRYLGEQQFLATEECPLRAAAENPDIDILRLVFERFAKQHINVFQNDGNPSPIFIAAYCRYLENVQFLLAQQNNVLASRDQIGFGKHILCKPIDTNTASSIKLVQLLLEGNCAVGNEINPNRNPLAICVSGVDESRQAKLELLLPKADASAKYTAMIAIAEKISFLPPTEAQIKDTFLVYLRTIIISCREPQCRQIAELHQSALYEEDEAKRFLSKLFSEEHTSAVCFGKDRIANNIRLIEPMVPSSQNVAAP